MEKVRSSKTARIVHQIKTAVRVLLTVQIKSLTAANLQIKAARRFKWGKGCCRCVDCFVMIRKEDFYDKVQKEKGG